MIIAALIIAGAAAPAQTPAETIVVTANRAPQPLERVGQSISVVDRDELDRRQTLAIADVLRTLPGVSIARNGGLGGVATVFIRGAESDQTVALIDGVKLNDPSTVGGGFNFGNLLVGNIERIEVLRGAQSVLWGSQAIGGVINMVTRQPGEAPRVHARAEYGWRNTATLVANASGTFGRLAASVGGGWLRSDGISNFAEARGGRERDGYENLGGNVNFRLALSDAVSLDARAWVSRGRFNADGFAPPSFAFGDVNEENRTREIVAYTGLNAVLLDGRWRNRLGFAVTDTDRRNTALDGAPFVTFAGQGRNERLEYQGILDLAAGWQTTFGAEEERSRYTTASFGGAPTRAAASIRSVYGQLVASPLDGFTATAGVRHDDHNRFGGATTLAGSAVYALAATGTTLRASLSEGFKAPSLFQLFSNFGNPQLRPERSTGWDAGVSQRLAGGRVEITATWFHRESTDLIVFIGCPQQAGICANRPFGTYDSVARARAQGLELALAVRPTDALQLQFTHGSLDARNTTTGSANANRRLPRRPANSSSLLVDYRWPFGLATGATVTNVSRSFENAANTQVLPGYTLVDLRAAWPLTGQVELTARIDNLFGALYETALNFGQPGRAAHVGLRLAL